jgi:hypothetical protein
VWPSPVALSGASSAHLNPPWPSDLWWHQSVAGLVPGQAYTACGWLKGEAIGSGLSNEGASVSLVGTYTRSWIVKGTFDWTERCVVFTPVIPQVVDVACRLGFYGSYVSGKVWCDNFSLEPVRKAF